MSARPFDVKAFGSELDALRSRLREQGGQEELSSLRRREFAGRCLSLLGYASAWLAVNPLSMALIALGNFVRWSILAHHCLHGGMDEVPGVPHRYTSKGFAKGWRRWLDWPDWILPEAWSHEHNLLHHYHTGQRGDPDLVEHNAWLMRRRWMPWPLKAVLLALFACLWKPLYYATNTYWALSQSRKIRKAAAVERGAMATTETAWRLIVPGERLLLPLHARALMCWLRCHVPYVLFRFGLLPLPFLLLGEHAWQCVLWNTLGAEVLANVWSFLVIGPNHTGDDLPHYVGSPKGRAEFYLQQAAGAANYTSPNATTDFLFGYLNYQIEHHLWPDLSPLGCRRAAPEVRAICERHGVPYIEASFFSRVAKLFGILTGCGSQRRIDMHAERLRWNES